MGFSSALGGQNNINYSLAKFRPRAKSSYSFPSINFCKYLLCQWKSTANPLPHLQLRFPKALRLILPFPRSLPAFHGFRLLVHGDSWMMAIGRDVNPNVLLERTWIIQLVILKQMPESQASGSKINNYMQLYDYVKWIQMSNAAMLVVTICDHGFRAWYACVCRDQNQTFVLSEKSSHQACTLNLLVLSREWGNDPQ